jgi:Lon protease-like protein
MARVPLFPLGTVLVPGASLPLQIFEPRYIVLLSDLLNAMDVPEFGVVAIRQGHEVGAGSVHDLHDVGCLARVTQAASLGDGRYLVVSTGVRRFHLDALEPEAGTAYPTGEVTVLEERTGDERQAADLGPWTAAEPDREFSVGAETPLAQTLEEYAAQAVRTDAIIAGLDLDDVSATPFRSGERPTLRWVLLHLIEENARHNGHLDLLRELADGQTGD